MISPDNSNTGKILPYRYYSLPVLVLLVLGIVNSAYLAYSHYQNYTDISFNSFCALTKAINCDTVSQSPWSILFGLPLAYWGFFSYLLFLILFAGTLSKGKNVKSLWAVLCLLALLYSLVAIYLGYISASKIRAYCILCLASYAISFALLFYSWFILRRFCNRSFWQELTNSFRYLYDSRSLNAGILVVAGLFAGCMIFLPPYWHYVLPEAPSNISTGITEEGHPWIGAQSPRITIHEYADYQCFQCSKMHSLLRKMIAAQPDTIRLVHHHYPMDHEFNNIVVPDPFHIGSGKMAMIAIYATIKDKFWDMNDALYTMGRDKKAFNTKTLAEMSGLSPYELAEATRHPEIKEFLLWSIRQGMKLGITGTPSYVIDGKVYEGSLPPEVFEAAKP